MVSDEDGYVRSRETVRFQAVEEEPAKETKGRGDVVPTSQVRYSTDCFRQVVQLGVLVEEDVWKGVVAPVDQSDLGGVWTDVQLEEDGEDEVLEEEEMVVMDLGRGIDQEDEVYHSATIYNQTIASLLLLLALLFIVRKYSLFIVLFLVYLIAVFDVIAVVSVLVSLPSVSRAYGPTVSATTGLRVRMW